MHEDDDCCKIELLESQVGRSASDIICDYCRATADKENYIDIILVGNQGADFSSNDKQKYLGSVANNIIRNTKLNVLFVVWYISFYLNSWNDQQAF